MTQPASSFIELNRIHVDYRRATNVLDAILGRTPQVTSVLRDISLHIPHGQMLTVYGASGSGKSTLLRVLAGGLKPSSGSVMVNGVAPSEIKDLAAGYVASEESEPKGDSVHDILYTFGTTHELTNLPSRLGEIGELVGLQEVLHKPADALSTSQRVRLNLARAALSEAPVILLDDTADILGVEELQRLLASLFIGRTILVATRFITTAEKLEFPLLILHHGQLVQTGTRDEIANTLGCPRLLDIWIEGLRYDMLRKLRQHPGVVEVRLLPSSRFVGQRLRITLHSARYLPSLYDMVSQAPLIRVQELPASLAEIITRL